MMPKRKRAVLLAACMMSTSAWVNALEVCGEAHANKVIVRKHDTLWGIAKSHLKSPWKWPQIWKLNQESIKDPDLIYPHQIILMPEPLTSMSTQDSNGPLPVIDAHVISVLNGPSGSGSQTILVIDKGARDGVEDCMVMTLYRKDNAASPVKHVATSGPGYGQLVVFRTYDKQSYASTRPSNLAVGLMDSARTTEDQNTVSANVMTPRQPTTAKHHFKRQGHDARACLHLKSDREIAACVERYRRLQ